MLNTFKTRACGALAALCLASMAAPAFAQYGFYSSTPYYSSPYYSGYVAANPYYDYDDYYYDRGASPIVRGAALGGLTGLGVSVFSPRHHRHYARNIGIGAGIGAGIGLLDELF